MSAALVNGTTVRTLDGRAQADEVVTEQDVQQPPKLARLLGGVLKAVAELRRAFVPRRIDFEDVAVSTSGAAVSLEHGFRGRVRWWVVGWQSAASTAPYLRERVITDTATPQSTDTTLVLLSYVAGTATIRVEEAG